ncbi:hypothetical protein [uncultured Sphingomonas sp.]|uniref:hypothetical protein n=1 Tax=uncultured Sphingomonas sp. TaxID=158754 RepID=UPI00263A1D7C|nr:hypothetical protein [uncultured Sphingomonas sp.]
MSRIKERVARLENGLAGDGRLIVISGPGTMDVTRELGTRGITTAGHDLVVTVNKLAETPICVTIDGAMI